MTTNRARQIGPGSNKSKNTLALSEGRLVACVGDLVVVETADAILGFYDGVDAGERFQVKRIVVKPGGILSLQMIEVQSGSYLGEDDIVRFEDVYGR